MDMKFGEYDFRTFTFGQGAHSSRDKGMCVMEAVAYVAGEEHSDHPKCASPVIATLLRRWNDSIQDDDRRRELLSPFVFRLPGTAANADIELQRSWMALDWLVRECVAEFMSLTPSLQKHAEILRGLPPIAADNFDACLTVVRSAGYAARDAARDAARVAAWDAAWDAVRVAAWDAAGDAAGYAAWDAARYAAGDAARVAAWDAARDAVRVAAWDAAGDAAGYAAWDAARYAAGDAARVAAWDAARDAARVAAWMRLSPSVARLQESAAKLVDRMIKLTEVHENAPAAPATCSMIS